MGFLFGVCCTAILVVVTFKISHQPKKAVLIFCRTYDRYGSIPALVLCSLNFPHTTPMLICSVCPSRNLYSQKKLISQLYTSFRLIAELPSTGGVLTSSSFQSVKLLRFFEGAELGILLCECLFLIQVVW